MPPYYMVRSLAADFSTNTPTNTTGAYGSGPTDMTVPQGVSKISRIRAAFSQVGAVVGSTGVVWGLRLTGNGLIDGQQDVVLGSQQSGATDTGSQRIPVSDLLVNIAVKPGNSVQPAFVYTGTKSWATNPVLAAEFEFS
jgi:hypothetical protein